MFVGKGELEQLIKLLHNPPSTNDEKIIDKLNHYDDTITKAIELRTHLQYDLKQGDIREEHFRICHQLISENKRLHAQLSTLQSKLVQYSKDRAQLRDAQQKIRSLERQLQRVVELNSFCNQAYDVIEEIEQAICQQKPQNIASQPLVENNDKREQFLTSERHRLQLLRRSLEERSSCQSELDLLMQDILESNRHRLRTQNEIIEGLSEQASKRVQLVPVSKEKTMKAWISNEKELIRNYENELKRLIKQDSQRKMDMVLLQEKITMTSQYIETIATERDNFKLQNNTLNAKINILLDQRKESVNRQILSNLSEKQRGIADLKQQIVQANRAISHNNTEIQELREQIKSMQHSHKNEIESIESNMERQQQRLQKDKKIIRQEDKQRGQTLDKDNLIQVNKSSKVDQKQVQALSKRTHSEQTSEIIKQQKKLDQLSKLVQQFKNRNEQLQGQLQLAGKEHTTFVQTIRKLEQQLRQTILAKQQLEVSHVSSANHSGNDFDEAGFIVSMRNLDDIISLITFGR